jgi:hypothetical protein
LARRIVECKRRKQRTTKLRGRVRVGEDLRRFGIKGWGMIVRVRESWRKILRGAEARTGL